MKSIKNKAPPISACPNDGKTFSQKSKDGKECCYVSDIGECQYNDDCGKLYKNYKQVCGQVWDSQCSNDTTLAESKNIKKLATQCLNGRLLFSQKCCNNKLDRAHCTPITRMRNIIHDCDLQSSKPSSPELQSSKSQSGAQSVKAINITEQDRANLLLTLKSDKVKRLIANGWKFKAISNVVSDTLDDIIVINIINSDKILLLKHD